MKSAPDRLRGAVSVVAPIRSEGDNATPAAVADRQPALHSAIVMADLMGSMRYEADVMLEEDGRLALAWTYGENPVPTDMGRAA